MLSKLLIGRGLLRRTHLLCGLKKRNGSFVVGHPREDFRVATFAETLLVWAREGEVGQLLSDLANEVFVGENLCLIFVHDFIPGPVDPDFPIIAPF